MLAGTRVPVLTRAGFRVVGRAGARGAIHAGVFHRAAGLVPGLARNPVSHGRAPTPGSGRGPGLTGRRRRAAGRVPAAWHSRAPRAVPARRRPASPGPHGLQERGGAANLAWASEPPTGMAAADRSVRRMSPGRAAGVPDRTPAHRRRVRVRPRPARPLARGAAAATVPVRARMRAARRKRWRGTKVCAAAGAAAAGPSRPRRGVRHRRAGMSCWTAVRPRAATCCPARVLHRAVACRRARTRRRAVAPFARTRRRDATRPTVAWAQAGPPGGAATRAGTRWPPGPRTLALRRHVASGRRTEPGLAGEGPAAGPRNSTQTWTRPPRTTGPAADPGAPGPVPGGAGGGCVPCCWPCWRSSSSRPVRWPR